MLLYFGITYANFDDVLDIDVRHCDLQQRNHIISWTSDNRFLRP